MMSSVNPEVALRQGSGCRRQLGRKAGLPQSVAVIAKNFEKHKNELRKNLQKTIDKGENALYTNTVGCENN